MELGPQNHNRDGLLGPHSIIVVYMDSQRPRDSGYRNLIKKPGGYNTQNSRIHISNTNQGPRFLNQVPTLRQLSLGMPSTSSVSGVGTGGHGN